MCRRCKTKIDQAHGVLLGNHDIVWFDISVDHILCVTMIYCLEKLLHISGCALFCECLILLLDNFLVHRHTFDVFHDEIDVFLIIVSFVILDNVWMVECVQSGDFVIDI